MSLFLTFEGLDGSGKSTQVRLLEETLLSGGVSVRVLREPGGTPVGESIRSILLDPTNTDLSDAAELFLFSASRSQLVKTVIRPLIAGGTTVLCDRFYDSTTAYQGSGRGLDQSMIAAVNKAATDGLVPDATFFLDVPLEVLADRLKRNEAALDRMEANSMEFHQRVRDGYLSLARADQRIHVLDGTRDQADLAQEIKSVCDGLEDSKHA